MNYNPFSLENKTILITGASSGIGRETAIECSKLGAKIIAVGRDEHRLKETISSLENKYLGHLMIKSDLTIDSDIKNILLDVDKLEGVVLCAGRGQTLPIKFCKKDKINDVFGLNYFSQLELLRLLVSKKKVKNKGSVVFVSSIGGVFRFTPGYSTYGVTKAAINSLMKYCAIEFAGLMIRVNSVNPGRINTKLINSDILTKEQNRKDKEDYLLKRYGEPKDVANGIIYLLSDASSWVTGHALVIDGGITVK